MPGFHSMAVGAGWAAASPIFEYTLALLPPEVPTPLPPLLLPALKLACGKRRARTHTDLFVAKFVSLQPLLVVEGG